VAWRSRRSRRCSCPCSGPAPFPDANGLLSFPRAAVEDDVLGVSTASRRSRCPCSCPAPGSSLARRDAAAARFLLPPSRRKQGRWRVENPKGVGGFASVPRLPGALLKRGRKQPGVDSPQCPWPFAGKGQVDPVAAACSGLGCARCGVLRSLPPSLGRIRHPMRVLRPSACGPLGWRAHRVARLAHRLG
jgi:hypothetical protein